MSNILLVAESGSDISPELAQQYRIAIVPMHVNFGEETRDDGTFPPENICQYYQRTGTLPKTSGCSPEDFQKVFNRLHEEYPQAHILHLAYSAVTTVSCQSAVIAANHADYITSYDTKHVSVGQGLIVIAMAKYLAGHPDCTPQQALEMAEKFSQRTRMAFVPDNLEYLRAGGRISNVVYYMGGQLLHLHPRVDVLDGKLVATKKYRGAMKKVVRQMTREYITENRLDKHNLWMLHTPYFSDELKQAAEEEAYKLGCQQIHWLLSNGVITTHGGPGAFAVAGLVEE